MCVGRGERRSAAPAGREHSAQVHRSASDHRQSPREFRSAVNITL